jgi:hypothetical protein
MLILIEQLLPECECLCRTEKMNSDNCLNTIGWQDKRPNRRNIRCQLKANRDEPSGDRNLLKIFCHFNLIFRDCFTHLNVTVIPGGFFEPRKENVRSKIFGGMGVELGGPGDKKTS